MWTGAVPWTRGALPCRTAKERCLATGSFSSGALVIARPIPTGRLEPRDIFASLCCWCAFRDGAFHFSRSVALRHLSAFGAPLFTSLLRASLTQQYAPSIVRRLAVASAYAVFILILSGIVNLIIVAVDDMLERKEAYQQRYSELYNATRDTLFEYGVDLDQVRGI